MKDLAVVQPLPSLATSRHRILACTQQELAGVD